MELSTAKLSSIAKFSQGKQIPIEEQYMDTNEKRDRFIRIVDFTSGFREAPRYVDADDKYHVNSNEIIMIRYGTPGKVYRGVAGIIANNMFKITFDKSFIDTNYGYWFLKQNSIYNFLMMMNCSATMPAITFKMLDRVQVQFPVISIQRRIASILSAYDNLIENNNKRIRLLEQMAENIYKEWFVRFRFPGHENAELENGLPKGWKEEIASNVIDVMSGGTPKTEREDYYGGVIPFYTPKDAEDSIFVYSTISNITEEGLSHCNSQYYPINTLMITARGTVGKLSLLAVPMAMNQSCFALKFKDSKNPYYLYYSIKNEVAKLKKMANGGVFDTIIVKTFDHIKIIIPSDKILCAFDEQVTPILGQIQNIQRQSTLLSRQRDLLLPRLMSGKLEVNF